MKTTFFGTLMNTIYVENNQGFKGL